MMYANTEITNISKMFANLRSELFEHLEMARTVLGLLSQNPSPVWQDALLADLMQALESIEKPAVQLGARDLGAIAHAACEVVDVAQNGSMESVAELGELLGPGLEVMPEALEAHLRGGGLGADICGWHLDRFRFFRAAGEARTPAEGRVN